MHPSTYLEQHASLKKKDSVGRATVMFWDVILPTDTLKLDVGTWVLFLSKVDLAPTHRPTRSFRPELVSISHTLAPSHISSLSLLYALEHSIVF